MHRLVTVFLAFLGLLIAALLIPPAWSAAARACSPAGWLCGGWIVALAFTGLVLTGLAALYPLLVGDRPGPAEPAKRQGTAFPHGRTVEIGIWLIAILAVYTAVFAVVIVPETIDEDSVFLLRLMDSLPVRETAVAFLAAGIGAIVATIHSYLRHAATRGDFKVQFVPWYILRPFLGSVLGVIFYWLMRGGILAVLPADETRGYVELNLNALAGICALVGMFSRLAIVKLRETFKVVFVLRDPNNADDPEGARREGRGRDGGAGPGDAD